MKGMIIVTILFLVEILTVLLMKIAGIEDIWVIIVGAATVVGAFWALKMESQKIRLQLEESERRRMEQEARIEEIKKEVNERVHETAIELKNKIDGTYCDNVERTHKKEINGLTILVADMGKDIKKMNDKIDNNHKEVLNTILSFVSNKVIS